ncbi:hypothetical protein ACN47E_002030 [Coniothyrium glycines]
MAPGLYVPLSQASNIAAAIVPHLKTNQIGQVDVPSIPPEKNNNGRGRDHVLATTISSTTLLLNPVFITTDFDELRFEAAASQQLLTTNRSGNKVSADCDPIDSSPPAYSTSLISSPYNSPGHYLNISVLPTASRLLALALSALKPTKSDYATAPYTEALNIPTVLEVLRNLTEFEGTTWRQTSFYVVVFRSKLKEGIDNDWLYKLDYESHREACESGGLLKYWFGKSSEERRNLATCFWHSREDAYNGGLGPWHKKARAAGRELYESIVFSTHRLTVLDGAQDFRFEDWKD